MAKRIRLTMAQRRQRDAKDAARWRWWRKAWAKDDDCESINDVQAKCRSAAALDAAVDEAIAFAILTLPYHGAGRAE